MSNLESLFSVALMSAKSTFRSEGYLDATIYVHTKDSDGHKEIFQCIGFTDPDVKTFARNKIKEFVCSKITSGELEAVVLMAEAWIMNKEDYNPSLGSMANQNNRQEALVVITWMPDGAFKGASVPIMREGKKAELKSAETTFPSSLGGWIDDAFKAASIIKAATATKGE